MAFTANPAEWNTTGTYLNLLIQQGETKEAEEIRDSLLNGYGDQPRAVLLASMADARMGNLAEATQRLEALVSEDPQLQAPKIALAMLYTQNGENDKAITQLLDAAKITPDAIQPLQQAGQIYAQNHSLAELEQWLVEIGEENPELAQNADTLAALVNIREGDLHSARSLLEGWQNSESVTVRRATAQLLQAEAQAALRSGDYPAARAKAAEAIALEPENLGYALMPAGIAQREEKYEEALTALDAVEETFGNQPAIVLSRASVLSDTQGTTAAHSYLREQWETSGNTRLIPPLIRLASTENPESINGLTNDWLEAEPDSVAAHMARADWLMANNQEIVAATHYEQVLAQQPNNVAALNNLAWLLRENDTTQALEYASQARELAPNNAAVLDTYGWILHLQGKHEDALDAIEQALSLAPDNADIKSHRDTVKGAM
jgi:tetratricopeptide (TPR) repeat protein